MNAAAFWPPWPWGLSKVGRLCPVLNNDFEVGRLCPVLKNDFEVGRLWRVASLKIAFVWGPRPGRGPRLFIAFVWGPTLMARQVAASSDSSNIFTASTKKRRTKLEKC